MIQMPLSRDPSILEGGKDVFVLTQKASNTIFMEAPGESAEHKNDEWVSKVRFFTDHEMAKSYLRTVATYTGQDEEEFEVLSMPFPDLYFLLPTLTDRSVHDFEAFLKLEWSECQPGKFPKTYMTCWEPHSVVH